MFKKFCIFMAAVFTMLISCAGPIMTRVHAADEFPTNLEALKIKNESPALVNNCHYAFCNTYVSVNNDSKTGAIVVRINDTFLDNVYCEYSNDIFILRSKDFSNAFDIFVFYDSWGFNSYSRSAAAIQFDFNNNSVYALDADSNYIQISGYDSSVTSCQFGNFETNFEEYDPNVNSLSLDVSFKPTLSGTISRKQTIDGKEYTSTTLDMYVSNNGSDAQFSMFIVNHGDSISFPTNTIEDNKGFIGNPVYCYVTDEWSSFNVGMLGNSVYSPCSWHSIASGFHNQLYSIPWNMMSLAADTQYDVVVYACVNDNIQQTNTSSMWDMRPVYTVSSSLNDVQEVYRSSFTITDPAVFDANSVDESGTTHSWNPNTDNSNLFNVSKAYRDDNGNVIIRGQTNSSLGDTPFSSGWFDNGSQNINSVFREYFGFLNKAIVLFPPAISVLFGIGLSSIIVIAVIKLLIKG